jgi:hypothetical protein
VDDRDISYINFNRKLPNASSDAFDDLFDRWYPGTIVFNFNAPPPSSLVASPYGADSDKFYRDVVARSCRLATSLWTARTSREKIL